MDQLHPRIGPDEKNPPASDHTAAWLVLIVAILLAIVVAVLTGDSVAFPHG